MGSPKFSRAISEDAYKFLINFQEKLLNLGSLKSIGIGYATYQMTDVATYQWSFMPLGSPTMSWTQFSVNFLEIFVLYSLRDQMVMSLITWRNAL